MQATPVVIVRRNDVALHVIPDCRVACAPRNDDAATLVMS